MKKLAVAGLALWRNGAQAVPVANAVPPGPGNAVALPAGEVAVANVGQAARVDVPMMQVKRVGSRIVDMDILNAKHHDPNLYFRERSSKTKYASVTENLTEETSSKSEAQKPPSKRQSSLKEVPRMISKPVALALGSEKMINALGSFAFEKLETRYPSATKTEVAAPIPLYAEANDPVGSILDFQVQSTQQNMDVRVITLYEALLDHVRRKEYNKVVDLLVKKIEAKRLKTVNLQEILERICWAYKGDWKGINALSASTNDKLTKQMAIINNRVLYRLGFNDAMRYIENVPNIGFHLRSKAMDYFLLRDDIYDVKNSVVASRVLRGRIGTKENQMNPSPILDANIKPPIYKAIEARNYRMFEILCSNGARLDCDYKGLTLFHVFCIAVQNGAKFENAENVLAALLRDTQSLKRVNEPFPIMDDQSGRQQTAVENLLLSKNPKLLDMMLVKKEVLTPIVDNIYYQAINMNLKDMAKVIKLRRKELVKEPKHVKVVQSVSKKRYVETRILKPMLGRVADKIILKVDNPKKPKMRVK